MGIDGIAVRQKMGCQVCTAHWSRCLMEGKKMKVREITPFFSS
jgi:hypothetical protein